MQEVSVLIKNESSGAFIFTETDLEKIRLFIQSDSSSIVVNDKIIVRIMGELIVRDNMR